MRRDYCEPPEDHQKRQARWLRSEAARLRRRAAEAEARADELDNLAAK